MTVIGVSFDLQQDTNFRLITVLEDLIDPSWCWRVDGGENYIRNSGEDPWDMQELFTNHVYTGKEFSETIQTPNQYIIFADLSAFPQTNALDDLVNLNASIGGDCQLAVIIVDADYVMLFANDVDRLIALTKHRPNFQTLRREDITYTAI